MPHRDHLLMRMKVLAILITMLMILNSISDSTAAEPPMMLTISAPTEIVDGDPIIIGTELTNVGKKPLHILKPSSEKMIVRMKLETVSQSEYSFMRQIKTFMIHLDQKTMMTQVNPGESISLDNDLTRTYWSGLNPGEYSLVAEYSTKRLPIDTGCDIWRGTIESNQIMFSIIQPVRYSECYRHLSEALSDRDKPLSETIAILRETLQSSSCDDQFPMKSYIYYYLIKNMTDDDEAFKLLQDAFHHFPEDEKWINRAKRRFAYRLKVSKDTKKMAAYEQELTDAVNGSKGSPIYVDWVAARELKGPEKAEAMERFIETYPASIFSLEIMLELREIYAQRGMEEKQKAINRKILSRFPDSFIADKMLEIERDLEKMKTNVKTEN